MYVGDLEKTLGTNSKKTVADLVSVMQIAPEGEQTHCLLLGAGASKTSGIRTGHDLVKVWRKDFFGDLGLDLNEEAELLKTKIPRGFEWYETQNEYACLIEKKYPLPRVRRNFVEQEVSGKLPSIGYAYLVRVADSGYLRTLFTTNFDDLINEAFYQFSGNRPLVCAHDSSVHSISISANRTKILKLHGDYLFDGLKTTVDETEKLEKNMEEKLHLHLKEYGLVLVGYSGGDKSIVANIKKALDDSNGLRNGLFWCLRKDAFVNAEMLSILRDPRAFYVVIDGFDEFAAEIYDSLVGAAVPFSEKIAVNRASEITSTYINSSALSSTNSGVIKRHLSELKEDKTVSLISDALTSLTSDNIASAGLSDDNFLKLLEIEKFIDEGDLSTALEVADRKLSDEKDLMLREILLSKKLKCHHLQLQINDAKKVGQEIVNLAPNNIYVKLRMANFMDSKEERVRYLEGIVKEHPYSAHVLNTYAEELEKAVLHRDKKYGGKPSTEITALFEKSTVLSPSINNPAWSSLYDLYSSGSSVEGSKIEELIDFHLVQNAYSAKTSALLFKYCKAKKNPEYKGRNLLVYLDEGFRNHFPRNEASHLKVIVDACCEFGVFTVLRKTLEDVQRNPKLKNDENVAEIMMRVKFDIYRDLESAITHGEEFLEAQNSPEIREVLLELYIEAKRSDDARECLTKLSGQISTQLELLYESQVLEAEGKYQDAIDTIYGLPDQRDFSERYTQRISYLELQLENYDGAEKRLSEFLEARSFNPEFDSHILNFEFARSKSRTGKKPNKKRLSILKENPTSPDIEAVARFLLGEEGEAVSILADEGEKKFSTLINYLNWPILKDVKAKLIEKKIELEKAKRSLSTLN